MVDIAEALTISKQSIHQWETTKTVPSADKLVELADYFVVSLDYLVGRSDDPERR
jgi:transcriptional regulator with XRE-family HTH domain